jgi:hypothetical protein
MGTIHVHVIPDNPIKNRFDRYLHFRGSSSGVLF